MSHDVVLFRYRLIDPTNISRIETLVKCFAVFIFNPSKYTQKPHLFPVYLSVGMTDAQKHWRRNKVSTQINRALREIASRIGFDVSGLSFYTARHTYADSLKKAGVSVDVISQALGHSDVRTTDNYLKSFGDDVIDAADKLLE